MLIVTTTGAMIEQTDMPAVNLGDEKDSKMNRATWKFGTLALIMSATMMSSSASADEVPDTGAEIGNHATSVIKTISNVFKGGDVGAEAQRELISMAGEATFVIALLFMCYIAASALGRFTGGIVSKKVDLTLGKFLSKAIRNVIMLIVAMVALEVICEINVAGFAAILAAAGFAIGMALQGTLGNFAAGVMLLIFRPFKVNDYIAVAGTEGTVEEIDLFTTRLNALDNRHLIIPNGEIFGAKLENYSRNQLRRVDVNVGAAYSANLDTTRAALERAANKVCLGMAEAVGAVDAPSAQVYLLELGASSVDWQLRVWCCPEDYWDVRERLTAAAKESLDEAGISIPFPQMDVHVVGKVHAKAA